MADRHAELAQLRESLAQMNEMLGEEPPLDILRQAYIQAGLANPMADGVEASEIELSGIPGLKMTPGETIGDRTLLYFHGGGYVIGAPLGHRAMVSHMAHHLKATAWSMDYRLAPEAPFPAAVEDGLASYRALLDAGLAANQIVISGDSAGGGLTLATALKIKAEGLPMPLALMPLSPWANLENNGWTYGAVGARDPMITKEGIDGMAAQYLNGADPRDPYSSPVNGDFAGLPPMLIQVGSEEVLLSDSTLLAERAGAAGVQVDLQIWPDMVHVFQYFHGVLSDAHAAFEAMADWMAPRW
ncbi:MAG: alpha/beta hydrolase [Pseudomonadota bacterium]